MIVITLQREKCIGCTFCKEHAPEFFRMSNKDGKATLLKSKEKKGFFTFKSQNNNNLEDAIIASENCPVKIIKVTKL